MLTFISINPTARQKMLALILNQCKLHSLKSREIDGVILHRAHFLTHLTKNGETIKEALKIRNFEHTSKEFAEVWSTMAFDAHPCVSWYISEHPL